MDFDEIREDILGEIEFVDGPSSFAYASQITTAPNPGLTIEDVGDIGLPLTERDAKAIIGQCQRSPFGKGEETIIDTSFSFRNPAWQACLTGLLDIVYRELGLTCGRQNVDAELYKLLLYEEGAFFRSHQDSEKTKGMFGTLVVSLASQHQGGEVALNHKKDQYLYDSSKSSQFGTSFAAWYSDVFHEVQKVTGGYRLVLTYNLVQKGTSAPQKAADFDGAKRLSDALERYDETLQSQNECKLPSYLIYKLDHPYTDDSIGLQSLKGRDLARVSYLNEACKDNGFRLYLATFSKELVFDEDYGEDEEIDRTEGFDDKYDMAGTKVAIDPQYSKANILDSGYETADEEANESEHEGWTGNEGAPIYRRYKDTMILIVPPARRVDFCIQEDAENPTTIMRVLQDFTSRESSATEGTYEYQQLKRLCELVARKVKYNRPRQGYKCDNMWERKSLKATRSDCMEEIANVCLNMNWLQIYKDIPIEFKIAPKALEALGSALARQHLSNDMEERVYNVVKAAEHINDGFAALRSISDSFSKQDVSDDIQQQFHDFERRIMVQVINDCGPVRKNKGKVVSDILWQYDLNAEIADAVERTLQICKAPTQAAFLIECSTRLHQVSDQRGDNLVTTFTRIMDDMWADFCFEDAASGRPLNTYEERIVANHSAGIRDCDTITAVELIQLLDLTQQFSERTLTAIEALEPIKNALPFIPVHYARHSLLPFLSSMCKREVSSLILPEEYQPSIKSFMVAGFATIIRHHVGPEPQRATDLSLPTKACHGYPSRYGIPNRRRSGVEKAVVVSEKKERRMPLSDINANAKRKAKDGSAGAVKKARTGVRQGNIEVIDLT